MSNTKCNLFVIGSSGVGKTFLISSLREFNYSRLETNSVFSKTDWIINTRYGHIEVEIKEKQKVDKNTIDLIEKGKNQKSFILFVTHLYQHKEKSFSFDEDLRLLKKLSSKATVIVAFITRSNETPPNLVLSQLRKEFPFVEFIFPISPASRDYERIYEFSFALRQIIVSFIPNQLALAKELIKKNFALKEKTLDLGNCNITSLYQIPELFKNTHLETLILSNEWGEYKGGKYIRRVSENEDSPNILFSLPKEISELKQLKVLICGGNWNGKRSSKTPIRWHISDISVLSTLSNLTLINASNNDIDTVGAIDKLENLSKLYLNNNNIEHFPDISNLKKLKEIYLSNNKLRKVDFLEKLSNITTVDLHSNRIQDLSPLRTLISKLNIKDSKWEVNSISVYRNPLNIPPREIVSKGKKSVLAYFDQLEAERKIKLKPFKNKDIKLIVVGNSNAGKSTLIHWLKTKKVDKKIATTHWLKFEQWVATMNRKTFHVRAFDFGGQEYYHDTHYLFFTNSTAYVLLWEADTDRFDEIEVNQRQDDGSVPRVKIQTFSLAYWLDSIKYHTQRRRKSHLEKSVEKLLDERDASISQSIKTGEDWTKHVYTSIEKIRTELDGEENILVAQNKIDTRKDKIFLDESSFKKDYPKIFDFSEVSVYKRKGLETFQTLLFEIFNNLEVVNQEYLGTWGHLKKLIEAAKFSKPLTLSEFKEYCNKAILRMPELVRKDKKQIQSVLFNEQDTQVFAEFLSDIGVCLFYPDNPVLKNKIFLNQTQILDNVYKALNGLNALDGEFTEGKIAGALDEPISSDSVTTTIELMIHFKILFKHPSKKKTFIAPLYLPKDPPQGVKIFQSLFKRPVYRYRYKTYIQKNIILDFFHHFGKKALKETNNDALYYYWRDGIIIRDDESGEIVMVKFVSGNNDQQCAYLELYQIKDTTEEKFLNEVVTYFDEINLGLSVTKLVPTKGKDYVPLDIIHQNEKEGNWIFHFEKKYFKLTDFKKYLQTPIKMKKIFISYSKQDLGLVNKFIEHLSALQLDGKVAHWYCSELEAGSKWNDEIQKHLDESDIICFMISPNFMKTDYIHEHEISRAFDRKKKDANFKIIPIILDFCRWTTTKNNLGEFTALPYTAKPVKDFNNQNMAWYIIEESLRLVIESDLDPKGDDFYSKQKLPSDVLKLLTRIIDGKVDNNSI